jgi:hypothetical protein
MEINRPDSLGDVADLGLTQGCSTLFSLAVLR